MNRISSARRLANFIQTLFCSAPPIGAKAYVKVIEESGNIVLIDKDEVASATIKNEMVTIVPHDSLEEGDQVIGEIINPETLVDGLSPDAEGVIRYQDHRPYVPGQPDIVAAVRVRPLGQGEFIEDRRFVELQFRAGSFLRAIAAAAQAKQLEEMILSGTGAVIQWRAGTHDIWIRRDQLLGIEIDKHEPTNEPKGRPNFHTPNDDQLNIRLVMSGAEDGHSAATDVVIGPPPQNSRFGPNQPPFRAERQFNNGYGGGYGYQRPYQDRRSANRY